MGALSDRAWRLINRREVTWRWVSNFGPTRAWRRLQTTLNAESTRVLSELRRDGIAKTSIGALGIDDALWQELVKGVEAEEARCAAEIQQARSSPGREGHKTYLVELLGKSPILDPASVFVRLAVYRPLLELVSSYFGMLVRLWQFNVWHNVPTDAPARNSQLWHRDPEDRQILRMFLYMEDVGAGSGPLSYVRGSHLLGAKPIRPEAFLEGATLRSNDEQMERVAPRETWATATGVKGDIWFVDTKGYHKGGHVATHDRIAYNSMWVSRACRHRAPYYTRPAGLRLPEDPLASFALDVAPGRQVAASTMA